MANGKKEKLVWSDISTLDIQQLLNLVLHQIDNRNYYTLTSSLLSNFLAYIDYNYF